MAPEDKRQKGVEVRRQLMGRHADRPVLAEEVAPELWRIVLEELFGNLYSRPALDLEMRSICTVSALIALGKEPQLKQHLRGALNVGVSREQIIEIITQLAFYAGVPAALNAVTVAKQVFDEADSERPSRQ